MFNELNGYNYGNYGKTSHLKFFDISNISCAGECGLKTNVWYEVIEWLNGLPIIDLGDGNTFEVLGNELEYAEIKDTYTNDQVLDIEEIYDFESDYFDSEMESIVKNIIDVSKKVNLKNMEEEINLDVKNEAIKIVNSIEKNHLQWRIDKLLDDYNDNPTDEIVNELHKLSILMNATNGTY